MNADEALAACLARGGDPELCHMTIEDQSVDGVYCDGEVVIDAKGKRCVDQAMLERIRKAREASPLPPKENPFEPPSAMPSVHLSPTGWALLGVAAVVAWRLFGK